jgi:hypothetical protein
LLHDAVSISAKRVNTLRYMERSRACRGMERCRTLLPWSNRPPLHDSIVQHSQHLQNSHPPPSSLGPGPASRASALDSKLAHPPVNQATLVVLGPQASGLVVLSFSLAPCGDGRTPHFRSAAPPNKRSGCDWTAPLSMQRSGRWRWGKVVALRVKCDSM